MTSAERKAAEASAPPVQTGYYDPNNPGMKLPCVSEASLLNMHLFTPPWIPSQDFLTGQAYVPPPAYYNDPPPGYTDTRDKKND